jgi:hypothetical protein
VRTWRCWACGSWTLTQTGSERARRVRRSTAANWGGRKNSHSTGQRRCPWTPSRGWRTLAGARRSACICRDVSHLSAAKCSRRAIRGLGASYLDSMVLVLVLTLMLSLAGTGIVLRRSWSLAVWAAGALESELRRGGSGGALPPV